MMPPQPGPLANPPATIGERRLLCLGGSFNPIHVGHLITARAAAESLGLPGVRLVPAAENPHKSSQGLAPASDRLEMCRRAIGDDPYFVVDDRELRRPPPSYTFDTVVEIAGDSSTRVPWLIGTDLLPKLHLWHRFDELLERVEFIVMRRAGHPIESAGLDERVRAIAVRSIVVPQIELSATTLRQRIREGRSIRFCVPDGVRAWIAGQALYRD